jgi:hypothetical protein
LHGSKRETQTLDDKSLTKLVQKLPSGLGLSIENNLKATRATAVPTNAFKSSEFLASNDGITLLFVQEAIVIQVRRISRIQCTQINTAVL